MVLWDVIDILVVILLGVVAYHFIMGDLIVNDVIRLLIVLICISIIGPMIYRILRNSSR